MTRWWLPAVIVIAAGCGSSARPEAATPSIALDGASIVVAGLPADVTETLEDAGYTSEQWASVFRVAVGAGAPPVLGDYAIDDDAVRFTPAFPLDPGRQYHVTFDSGATRLSSTVGLPASTATPSTVVARVYPTGDVVPENLLRMYVEFSAPMGRRSGIDHIKVLDHSGKEIRGAVLPLDYEFWSPDHTRFTVFFDPGRVKDGILPNREMGRPLESGRTMTLAISREWRDANGLPLREDFVRRFRVADADAAPLDTSSWHVTAPRSGGRAPLVVTFPEPLDHGLLMRALGVTRDGTPVEGDAAVEAGETRWTFTPRAAWAAATYELLALDILEDLAGNQIGRAFEVDNFDSVDKSPQPKTVRVPFLVR